MKKAFYISLSFNVLIILFIAGKRYYYSHSSGAVVSGATSFYDQWNKMRNSTYATMPVDSNDIVFVGNSLTEAFPVTEIYGPHYKNRGVGGNQTNHILNRIGDIARNHPRKIFLEGGVNDLNAGCNVDSVYNNYTQIIDSIKIISPRTILFVQSVLPTCYNYGYTNDVIFLLNNKLSQYCKLKGLTFIDIHSKMVIKGTLNNALTEDGIHLNGNGYAIWRQCVQPYIQ